MEEFGHAADGYPCPNMNKEGETMPSQITNYQCPACNGGLHFSSATGRLECEYCGSSYSVAEIEAYYAKKDEAAAAAQAKAEAKAEAQAAQAAAEGWDLSGMSADWGPEAAGMKAYNCPSCGAELICGAATAATQTKTVPITIFFICFPFLLR